MPRVGSPSHRPWVGLLVIVAGITLGWLFRRPQSARDPAPPSLPRANENVSWRSADFALQLGPSSEASPAQSLYETQATSDGWAEDGPGERTSPVFNRTARPEPVNGIAVGSMKEPLEPTPPQLSPSYRTALNLPASRPVAIRTATPIRPSEKISAAEPRSSSSGEPEDFDSVDAQQDVVSLPRRSLPATPAWEEATERQQNAEPNEDQTTDRRTNKLEANTQELAEVASDRANESTPAVTLGLPILVGDVVLESDSAGEQAVGQQESAEPIAERLALRSSPLSPEDFLRQMPLTAVGDRSAINRNDPAQMSAAASMDSSENGVATTIVPPTTDPSSMAAPGSISPPTVTSSVGSNLPQLGNSPWEHGVSPIVSGSSLRSNPPTADKQLEVNKMIAVTQGKPSNQNPLESATSQPTPPESSSAAAAAAVAIRPEPERAEVDRSEPRRWLMHTITDGDSLPAISRRYFGTEERWREIFADNSDSLKDPELLPIGTRLRIRRD